MALVVVLVVLRKNVPAVCAWKNVLLIFPMCVVHRVSICKKIPNIVAVVEKP